MRKQLATAALLLAATCSAQAQQKPSPEPQDNTKPSPRLNPVQAHARRLSDQMARDLRLNGYQKTRLQAINEDKQAKIVAINQRNAGNTKLIAEQCNAVCKERDQELQSVLSTNQYSAYYDSRKQYNTFSMDFLTQPANAIFVKSVQNPLPASSNGAVLTPGRTTEPTPRTR
ncbi:hypothetical protein [Hymenobacter weizhouensis]|uniref:hypothetical protein n=1 Tax=Hymenobacter sp. YIM 151500-1 TaxID=2987689 RepID=UPI0022267105|nr:hypothetical protein [Hymenobacter sp. YIM 151500-1]UYZ64570.1 hypothetical protein OIS53_06895 [Hymenobacter sp. YIM 151500-1]